MKELTLLAFLLTLISCDDCCSNLSDDQTLLGKWTVVEFGYSPGGAYVTQKLEQNRFVEFGSDNHFSSNYNDFTDIRYYRLTEASDIPMLELFPNEPEDNNPNQLVYKYRLNFEENMVKLLYVYCVEGCHIAIQRGN